MEMDRKNRNLQASKHGWNISVISGKAKILLETDQL